MLAITAPAVLHNARRVILGICVCLAPQRPVHPVQLAPLADTAPWPPLSLLAQWDTMGSSLEGSVPNKLALRVMQVLF